MDAARARAKAMEKGPQLRLKARMKVGADSAGDLRSRTDKIKHSKLVHRHTSAGRVQKDIAMVATAPLALLGIPFVSGVASLIATEGLGARHKRKMHEHLEDAKEKGDVEREVKYSIRTLNVEAMDRGRSKIQGSVRDLADWWDAAPGQSSCNDLFQGYKLLAYIRKRVLKLKGQATAMIEIAEAVEKWCDKVLLATKKDAAKVDHLLEAYYQHYYEDEPAHKKCDKFSCIRRI